MLSLLKWLFGTAQERTLRKYRRIVAQVNVAEESLQVLSAEALAEKTKEFKERLKAGASLDDLLVEAYAVVKNCCRRFVGKEVHVSGYTQKWDMIPYDVQILGAISLHHGSITEMQTGEGKTITAAMPLYLNALSGRPVHIVTVNDYLAKRDCEWIGSIFRNLGLTTGVLQQNMGHDERKVIYGCDIVYGTASEFGFDYLRDNSMASNAAEQVQRGDHFFALIDEVDSILIDEARTPLIISGPSAVSRHLYKELQAGVAALVQRQKEECQRIALDAKKVLERFYNDHEGATGLSAEEYDVVERLWLVSKGTPRNKVLKKLKEHPDIRAAMDKWDLHYYKEQNKELRAEALAKLYVIIDERANEYELTEKGIIAWIEGGGKNDDFVMLDLGHELLLIDQDTSLSTDEKLARKLKVQEEDAVRKERSHNLRQLLRAHLLMEKDVDYIIQDEKIVIIDEHTGRMQPGRRFSDGLHQAIEAKESVDIQRETQTYATVTLQNYFRMYTKLAGMTGTAITEAHEFKDIYKLHVLQIPTHKPCCRVDKNDEMYMTEREKYAAILNEVKRVHGEGRPILLGTESVEVSEKLSRLFKLNKLDHTVLNAKNHSREAEIIAMAGQEGAITIATNMAGRGTDIKLGAGIAERGGLHVIGSTRHQSRRIDRQLRGRSGRQGDPGSSQFYISLEDSLMRLFASPALTSWLQKFRPPEGEPISASILNKSIETAQKRVESRNYTIRKHTLEYDDVMNKQRQEVYSFRNELLHSESSIAIAVEVIEQMILRATQAFEKNSQEVSVEQFRQWLAGFVPVGFGKDELFEAAASKEGMGEYVSKKIIQALQEKVSSEVASIVSVVKEEEEAKKIINGMIRSMMLRGIDNLWQRHLLEMDHLRSDVHLRAIGQKDPLVEFKHEAFRLFDALTMNLREETTKTLFKFHIDIISAQERPFFATPDADEEEDLDGEEDEDSFPLYEDDETPSLSCVKTEKENLCSCGKSTKNCCQAD